jgi:pyruvate formate lyase activating enzyme
MDKARSAGAVNVLVTNGCINAEAAEEILSRTDAANIDLKSFSEKTYSSVFGGNLPAVLDFIRLAVTLGVHTEITTLVVPGLNDSNEELMSIAEFIAGLAATNKTVISIPWHVSAYHPDWKWKTHFGKAHPPTEPTALFAIAERARAILSYVYTGNIAGEHNDTFCSYCGAALAIRRNYRVNTEGLSLLPDGKQQEEKPLYYRCAACGTASPVRWT